MANSGLTQRQNQPNNNYHCKDCGVYFDSIKSLDVHLHYHKENLLSKWATQAYAQEESNNNTNLKNSNNAKQRGDFHNTTIAAAADSSDAHRRPPSGNLGYSHQNDVSAADLHGRPPSGNLGYSHQNDAGDSHGRPPSNNVIYPHQNDAGDAMLKASVQSRPPSGNVMYANHNDVGDAHGRPPAGSVVYPHQSPVSFNNTPSYLNHDPHRFSPANGHLMYSYHNGMANKTPPPNNPPPFQGYPGYPGPSYYETSNYPDQFNHRPAPPTVPSPSYRYHPYQPVTSSSYPPPPSSPQQCDKCGTICDTSAALSDHLARAHPPTPVSYPTVKQELFDFHTEVDIKTEEVEPTAEILDLDSHKVHVYDDEPRPANGNGNPHSVSAMLWGSGGVTSSLASPQPPAQNYPPTSSQRYRQEPSITSTQVPNAAPSLPAAPSSPQTAQSSKGNASWKSNEARRPKTYNCSACNKWFTSSGHLKRHYNTTLHKNAVKQSGQPDPATLPINTHHHPDRDPNYVPRGGGRSHDHSIDSAGGSPESSLGNEDSSRSEDFGQMMNNPNHPNRQAGPSEYEPQTGGLQHSLVSSPPPMRGTFVDHHSSAPPHPVALLTSAQMEQQLMQHNYPNAQPPHVITSQIQPQVTNTINTNQITSIGNPQNGNINHFLSDNAIFEELQPMQHMYGNVNMFQVQQQQQQQPLPSFAQLNHQVYPGQTLAMLHGFNGLVSPPSYMVQTTNVGGLFQQSPSNCNNLLMEAYNNNNNNNNYITSEVTSLTSEQERHKNQIGSNHSDSSTSMGEEVLSPIGTPDCPTSTISGDFDDLKPAIVPKTDDTLTVSSTNDNVSIYTSQSISNGTVHKCIDCDKVFNKACYLTQHNKSFHSGAKPFKCNRCGKRFTSEYQYEEHLLKHAPDKPYKCEICPKQFNHKTDLRRHLCLHTGEKPYACEVCGKGFIRKDHMLKHCVTHRRKITLQQQQQQQQLLQQQQQQHIIAN